MSLADQDFLRDYAAMTNAMTLAAPGAGVPKLERLLIKFLLKASSPLLSRQSKLQRYQKESEIILSKTRHLDASKLSHKVLIRRLPGLEDSSRNWSINDCLEHLITVGSGISQIISALNSGHIPDFEVRIQDVKPKAAKAFGPKEFEAACRKIKSAISESSDKSWNKAFRFKHPWFGPLHSSEWLSLLAAHQKIHRNQIQKIIEGLA